MRLPDDEWLHHAKRLAINQSRRVRHKHEPTEALIVSNKPDRWMAYCQRCKHGAVLMKEHAMLVTQAPAASLSLALPSDMRSAEQLEQYELSFLAGFMASKGMDFTFLSAYGWLWSESRHRLMFNTKQGWLGRDTSGKSPQKWLSYTQAPYVEVRGGTSSLAVVTEDLFSAYKVASAVDDVDVYCSLGTAIHAPLLAKLVNDPAVRRVTSFYDGDVAGHKGALSNAQKLRVFGVSDNRMAVEQCAPRGLDPKDMELRAIAAHLEGVKRAG